MKLLDNQVTNEISTVRNGANKRGEKRRFPFIKGVEEMPNELISAVLETPIEGEENFCKNVKLSDKGKAATVAVYRIVKSFFDELPKEALAEISKTTGYVETKVEKVLDGEQEQIRKSLEETINQQKTQIGTLQKQHEEITKAFDKVQEAQSKRIWLSKCEKECSHYPGKSSEELAEQLYKYEKINKTFADDYFQSCKLLSDTTKQSSLLKSAGENRESASLPVEQKLNQVVEEIKKNNPTLSNSEAFKKAMLENAKLYDEYLTKNPSQGN